MNFFANFLTILALACGFSAIIFSFESRLILSAWLVIIAAVFDGLDGQISRINFHPNEFGRHLDSLADAVSFGVAPAIIGYIFASRGVYLWPAIVLFVYLAASVLRLARYNVTPKEKSADYFSGLPITVSGGIIASFVLLYRDYAVFSSPRFFLFVVLLLAFSMLSKTRYINLGSLLRLFAGKNLVFFVIAALTGMVFRPRLAIFSLFSAYLLIAPFLVKKGAPESR